MASSDKALDSYLIVRRRLGRRGRESRRRRTQSSVNCRESIGLRRLQFEPLEQRTLLSMNVMQYQYVVYDHATDLPVSGSAVSPGSVLSAGMSGSTNWAGTGRIAPFTSASPIGLTPAEIRGA